MKVTAILLLSACLSVSAGSLAQKITLLQKNVKLEKVFREIRKQTGYVFFYDTRILQRAKPVDIHVENVSVEEALKESLQGQPLDFSIEQKTITIFQKADYSFYKKPDNVEYSTKEILTPPNIINGTVKDAQGNPLASVSVIVKGTTKGTSTNTNGSFSIDATVGDVLEFTIVGYQKRSMAVGQNNNISVVMEIEVSVSNEVVVVGYGTQKKINLTGAIKQLDGEDLSSQPSIQTSSALMGKVAGVEIIQNSGQPGQNKGTIRIRGTGTLGDANPLILIDGIPGELDNVPSTDIASVTVLKDAAAAAVYGSRAANGVILITTKRGTKGKTEIRYNGFMGWQRPTTQPKFVDGAKFMELQNLGQKNLGLSPIWPDTYIQDWKANSLSDPDHYPSTNWVKEAFSEPGLQQRHQFSISSGSEIIRLFGSLLYDDENSNILNYGFKRYSFRINTDIYATHNLNFNFDVSLLYSEQKSPSAGVDRIVADVFRIPSVYVSRYSNGGWGPAFNLNNPIAYIHDGGLSNDKTMIARARIGLNYNVFEGLNLKLSYSPDLQIWNAKNMTKNYDIADLTGGIINQIPGINSLSQSDTSNFNQNLNATLQFQKSFGKHTLSILGGYEFITFKNSYFGAFRDQFLLQNLEELNAGSVANQQNDGSASEWALQSFFSRINYNYNSKYLFEANVRNDGSSRFNQENRWGIFPSFSAGWVVSKESFMKALHFLSNFKIRGSWGILGNQQIGTYPFISTIDLGQNYIWGGTGVTGAAQLGLSNSAITWEKTVSTNLGFDIALLGNRLNLSLDLFNRKTSDILLQLPVPLIIGLSAPFQNAGEVENSGWEMEFGYKGKEVKDFSYGLSFNISNVKNRVTNLKGAGPFISGNSITIEGSPIGAIFGYRSNGFFNSQQDIDTHAKQSGQIAPGDIQYVDQNNDGIINADDRVIIGDPFPSLNYGINLSARYKGFDIAVFFQGIGRQNVYLSEYAAWPLYNGTNIRKWQAESFWTPENMNAKMPRFTPGTTHSNFLASDFWVYDASYLRLRNFQLGYTFSSMSFKKFPVKNLRLFFLAENLFTFFDKMPQGVDPNVPNGSTYFPINRLLAVGMNINF